MNHSGLAVSFQHNQQIDHSVEKVPVMADDDHGAVKFQQGLLKGIAGPQQFRDMGSSSLYSLTSSEAFP